MASAVLLPLLLLTTIVSNAYGQSTSVGSSAFRSLDGLGCSQFKAIILEAQLEQLYDSAQPLTIFVFNDTAYAMMPPYRQGNLYDQTGANNMGAKEYVSSFTLNEAVETTSFSSDAPYETNSFMNRKLFLDRKQLRLGNVASGIAGPTKYFCNGAMVTQPNIQAGQHVIHIIDQVLDMPYQFTALAYVSGFNHDSIEYQFYAKFMAYLLRAPQEDGEYNYQTQVQEPMKGRQVTFFLPSDEAISKIPSQKLSELQGNLRLMLEIITLHIIPNQVIYTNMVNHNEQFNTQFNSGRVVFRKNFDRESVYVTGALKSGNTVTGLINPANRTVLNGVIHQIDAILGFVYKTVVEEISIDPVTQNFEQLINAARKDLQNYVTSSSGVVVFAPTNQAMYAIANVYENYINNQSLLNMVFEMSLLQQGQTLSLMDYNRGYESYNTAVSRYNARLIKVYSMGNDTWVEGGYVKARVIKPDIGCTNGLVHQIDAVFGIPTRDIPYTIFCEDRLESTFIQLQYVGLDKYMRDPTLTKNQECQFSTNTIRGSGIPNSANTDTMNNYYNNPNELYQGLCGGGIHRCEFTFFVPNGTAIDKFASQPHGRAIMNDPRRWRWLMRRLISNREKIYLDQLAYGAPRSFYADNGEEVIIQTDSSSNIPSGQRVAYLMFEGQRVQVLHSDLGATNGVIHIISDVLFVQEDLTRELNGATTSTPYLYTVLLLSVIMVLLQTVFTYH